MTPALLTALDRAADIAWDEERDREDREEVAATVGEQPYLFGPTWIPIKDGNPTAMQLFLRHYTARARRKIYQFVGPGEHIVLLTPDAKALFVWRKFISDAAEIGVNCAVFRNEGSSSGQSSSLIEAAKQIAWGRWPGERLYTYVDPSKVRHKRDPGRCFVRAGFRRCGTTKSGKLIFECLSSDQVAATATEPVPEEMLAEWTEENK